MQSKNLIEEILFGYEDFLRYCKESGKRFVDELDREDFIAYRAEYSVSREQVEQIKKLLSFQDQKFVKKISLFQDIADELDDSNDSLAHFFNIDDPSVYEKFLISAMDFNVRVHNCLKFNGYVTLDKLLKSSHQELANLKNFGDGSFNNLIATLKKFFASQKKKIPTKKFASEELDDFLRNAALNHDPKIDLIIYAFETFSKSVTIKNLFCDLPEIFKDKNLRSFLLACGLENDKLFVSLPDDLTLAELPKFLIENSIEFDTNKLKKFVDSLNFDVRTCAKKIFASVFRNKRDFDIICLRVQGNSLEEIGKIFGVTRERIRQVEAKSVYGFKKHYSNTKKIFCFLHALTYEKYLLTLDDAKNFLDSSDAEILWFFVAKINLSNSDFHFDDDLNAIIFGENIELNENDLLKNLPCIVDEKFFEETVKNFVREKDCSVELIKVKLSKFYKHRGKIFHRGRLTLTSECEYVLKERFPFGYKISDESFYSRFMRYFREIFDEKTLLTQHNVDTKIGAIGFLCDRGKYIHPDFVNISPEIIKRVQNFIDASDYTAIFYKEIFETLKDLFIETQITNRYFLQGAIKFHKLPYILRKDYLTKADEFNMTKEFENFVAERGEVSTQEIKENFISFEDFNIFLLVERCPEIIRIGDGILVHATHLNIHEKDFDSIKNFLRQNCSKPINSRVLFDLFFERFSDFMTRNDIQNHSKLFGILRYMFHDDFYFSRSYISETDVKDISNKKFLLSFLEHIEEIDFDDLFSICEENGIHYVSKSRLIDSLRPDFIRVDEFSLMRSESIGVSDEFISAVVENIELSIERNGGWQSAQTFDDYEWLPQLEIPWNSFLLESVASLADDALYTLKIPSTLSNFSSTIFLSEEFAEDDYQSCLTKILLAEHDKKPFRSDKEIFDWLKAQGLCSKKFPKFLEGRRFFDLLRE